MIGMARHVNLISSPDVYQIKVYNIVVERKPFIEDNKIRNKF